MASPQYGGNRPVSGTISSRVTSSRNADKFVVRMPDGLRERIAETAKEAARSMNSEIVHRLEQSLEGSPVTVTQIPKAGRYWLPQLNIPVLYEGKQYVIKDLAMGDHGLLIAKVVGSGDDVHHLPVGVLTPAYQYVEQA